VRLERKTSSRSEAIDYFHFRGTTLPQELRGGPDINPKGLADLVAMQITQDWNAIAFHAWRGWPPEEVERDPRFIAHKCAFNRDMVLRMTNMHSERHRSRAEALEIVRQVNFEEFAAFFGETLKYAGKPN
jgi:hypothetical protein